VAEGSSVAREFYECFMTQAKLARRSIPVNFEGPGFALAPEGAGWHKC
jgi:hypothetical protein